MEFGITAMLTDQTIGPVELAVEAEQRHFTSLFLPEHTHIPTRRKTPHPSGGPLPDEYKRTLDPIVALAMAAQATGMIRLGTGIALVAARDPFLFAKELATLDHLAGGRVVLGAGLGWNVEELADHGVDFEQRRQLTREKIAAMRALWRDDEAAYEGDLITFGPAWSWPKPAARQIPVWLGVGAGPRNLADVAAYADAWIPVGGSGLSEAIPKLRAACEQAGRDPDEVGVVPFGSLPTPGKLDHFADLGVAEVVVLLPSAGRDETLAALDKATTTIDSWRRGGA